jgi:hypothetical protein
LFLWHAEQACVAWTPTNWKNDEWLRLALRKVASVGRWHESHVEGNPAAAWFGLVVRW